MLKIYISKTLDTNDLPSFVLALNKKTRDAYIADQMTIDENVWLVRIACTYREDADIIRAL